MKIIAALFICVGGLACLPRGFGSQFAVSVVDYTPGTGFAAGYTNAAAILGAPSIVTDDPQFGPSPVDPMDPPYLRSQLVSVGSGGTITVKFDRPITHSTLHPYGFDFIVFGHAGFDTGPDYNGIANGTLFDNAATASLVSVSADGTNFFLLNPAQAPPLDALFPTDGLGDPSVAVNPVLTPADFAQENLAQIRTQYDGSAGGTAFSLAWALDTSSNSITLPSIQYVRLEVLQGHADLDAVAAVAIPEGSAGAGWHESFQTDPALNGWKIFGDSTLFRWDNSNENIAVTWNSASSNSYFYKSLGARLDRQSTFAVDFDLQLADIAAGSETGKPSTFELSVGLLDFTRATNPVYWRGTGSDTPELFEFDYFPDSGFGATIWPTIVSSNNDFLTLNYSITPLQTGTDYHISMNYSGSSNVLNSVVTQDGIIVAAIADSLPTNIDAGFTLDTFAIESYSSAGQNSSYAGSILAHGSVDNVQVSFIIVPGPVLTIESSSGTNTVRFETQTNAIYTLQRSVDFVQWLPLSNPLAGQSGQQSIVDTNAPSGSAFYRVLARRN